MSTWVDQMRTMERGDLDDSAFPMPTGLKLLKIVFLQVRVLFSA